MTSNSFSLIGIDILSIGRAKGMGIISKASHEREMHGSSWALEYQIPFSNLFYATLYLNDYANSRSIE
ncbi:hypothetical protein [Hazenella coriacea]|uniref:hypothetical protein n=1 Tax=Hazenella coriacea TaxID=1179467 RepID=UPI0010537E2F|nr:hypothetical protein [Hazenella coriacea]